MKKCITTHEIRAPNRILTAVTKVHTTLTYDLHDHMLKATALTNFKETTSVIPPTVKNNFYLLYPLYYEPCTRVDFFTQAHI